MKIVAVAIRFGLAFPLHYFYLAQPHPLYSLQNPSKDIYWEFISERKEKSFEKHRPSGEDYQAQSIDCCNFWCQPSHSPISPIFGDWKAFRGAEKNDSLEPQGYKESLLFQSRHGPRLGERYLCPTRRGGVGHPAIVPPPRLIDSFGVLPQPDHLSILTKKLTDKWRDPQRKPNCWHDDFPTSKSREASAIEVHVSTACGHYTCPWAFECCIDVCQNKCSPPRACGISFISGERGRCLTSHEQQEGAT